MDLRRIADKAKELVDKRGGTDSLKEDAGELKDIARGEGSATEKAKEAFEAIKDPGGEGAEQAGERVQEAAPQPPPERGGERERGREGGRGGRRGRGRRRGRDRSGGPGV